MQLIGDIYCGHQRRNNVHKTMILMHTTQKLIAIKILAISHLIDK